VIYILLNLAPILVATGIGLLLGAAYRATLDRGATTPVSITTLLSRRSGCSGSPRSLRAR